MYLKTLVTAQLIALSAAMPAMAVNTDITAGPASEAVISRSVVFAGGDGVSKFYRIPAITTLADGTLVAVADRRLDSNKDLPGRIDVVCRRSTDGGLTWGPTIEVAVNDSVGGYGDPGIGIAPDGSVVVVMTHGNGLWESTREDHASLYASRSTDGGLTWSVPYNISENVFASDGSAPVTGVGAFATSGHIATLADGRMMFALVARLKDKKWSELDIYPVESRDGGVTWTAIPVSVDSDADESKIEQLPDKSLLMSIRNRRKGYRKFARSTDGGHTWTAPEHSTTLPDPACNGDMINYNHRGRHFLLHSVPDSHTDRSDVSIFASDDNGATWRKLINVVPVRSAYSALSALPDGTVAIFTEEASSRGGFRLWCSRVDVARLIDEVFDKQ